MRIVSLLPSATELLFALGAGAEVVGVTHECDYPPQARALPRLTSSALPNAASPGEIDRHVRSSLHAGSSLYHLDSDLLERLAPDLIVTQELCAVCAVSYTIVAQAARRLSSDPRVVSLEPSTLEDVYANIGTLGELVKAPDQAERLVQSLRGRERVLRHRYEHRTHPRTLLLEWTDPPMGAGHWVPELIEIAGGMPVLCCPGGDSKVIEWDAIADESPDVVLIAPCGFGIEASREAVEALQSVEQFTQLRAYREQRVFPIDGNAYVSRPGPRLLDTAEIFARCIHHT
ncbi:MAG: cobalamin-binding protein [Vulcanimicrobiaceae bacterium]